MLRTRGARPLTRTGCFERTSSGSASDACRAAAAQRAHIQDLTFMSLASLVARSLAALTFMILVN
eukprot:3143325-Heterocapsa_arctica.AAC.1